MSPRRRGFALPLVILVLLVGSLGVAVALQRAGAQRLAVERQVDDYRLHHEMLGAQAVLKLWLQRLTPQDLAALSSDSAPAYRVRMPTGMELEVFLSDGQGAVKSDLTNEFPEVRRGWFEDVLFRLPADRPDLLRRVGPPEISVNGAPREVLAALRADDASLADTLLAERTKARFDAASFRAALESHGLEPGDIDAILRVVAFEPTIWRLRVLATRGGESRVFTALAEPKPTNAALYEWREVEEPADQSSADEPATLSERPRNRAR